MGAKNRKGGALRPRLPVRCRASRPFGTIGRRSPRPFGLLITRSAPMVSHESGGVIRPRSLFNVALLRRDSRPGRAGTKTAVEFAAQSTLSTLPHGIAARPPDRGTPRVLIPSAFSRPWQWATLGLPCPVSFPPVSNAAGFLHRHFPQPVTSQSEHTGAGAGRIGMGRIIPTIHRRCCPDDTLEPRRVNQALPLPAKSAMLTPSRGAVSRVFCGVLRVVPCVMWATTVAPARSV